MRLATCSSNMRFISPGTPGMKYASALAQSNGEARGGAHGVRQDLGALGEIGLLGVRRA